MVASQSNSVTNGALGIHINDQRFEPASRECSGEVYGGGRLPDATLLADDC
jgi:hypothetical protein